jgi:hypothetical protein
MLDQPTTVTSAPAPHPVIEASGPLTRRSRLRLIIPTVVLLAVAAPFVVHSLGVDVPAPVPIGTLTYYVRPDGDDTRDGLTPDTAWRTLAHADWVRLKPGDRLLLRGDGHYSGGIGLGRDEAGDPAHPVVIESYGPGRATIDANGSPGITVQNTAGVEIHNLAIVGDAWALALSAGIRLFSDLADKPKLEHVVISDVDVTGFRTGIEVVGARGRAGFRDVTIRRAVLHGNRDAGLITRGPDVDPAAPVYAHESVTVSYVESYDNRGDAGNTWSPTGSGIVLGSVRDGVVERSVTHDNGLYCSSRFGPVGIWAYDSTALVIQHNTSYHNRSVGLADGGGFDFDRNVSASTMQYNVSYDNDGPGYLLYGERSRRKGVPDKANTNNIIRFNISRDDSRRFSHYGGITMTGIVNGAQIYHNSVVISANGTIHPPAIHITGRMTGVTVRNNIFLARGDTAVHSDLRRPPEQILLQGNDIYAPDDGLLVYWGAPYQSLAPWRDEVGQERAVDRDTGISADPGFVGSPRRIGSDGAAAFALRDGSPLVGEALDLAMFGINPGPVDILGHALGAAPAIGAVTATS